MINGSRFYEDILQLAERFQFMLDVERYSLSFARVAGDAAFVLVKLRRIRRVGVLVKLYGIDFGS